MKTTLVVTALNEIDGVKLVMPRIQREWVDEIIFVDGGSIDGTLEYAEGLGLKVIRQKSKGIVGAYWEALEIAQGDVIITFSPDGNSIPEKILELVDKMKEGYDMVIVSRYREGAKSYDDDLVTAFGNWFFTKLINWLFGGQYTDSLVMFRAWRRNLIETLEMADTSRAGFETKLAIDCARKKLRVTEIPGDEPKRIGQSARKMRPLANGIDVLTLILQESLSPVVRPRFPGVLVNGPITKEELRR